MARSALLACGILASAVYVVTDMLAAARYEGYSLAAQAVSELSAIGSPTRPLVITLFFAHGLLQLAFGIGVWQSVGHNGRLRLIAGCLMLIGLIDLGAPLFPMHMRGAANTLTDTVHIAMTSVMVTLILLAVGVAAGVSPRWFRRYSIATLTLLISGGALAAWDGVRLAANEPTPWLGVTERLNIYGYMLWMALLATTLLRARTLPARS
jgi:hypothetical protein